MKIRSKKIYGIAVISILMVIAAWNYISFYNKIPNTIKIRSGYEETVNFDLPVSGQIYKETVQAADLGEERIEQIAFKASGPMTFKANQVESYKMDVRLLGIIPLKSIDLDVVNDMELTPVGKPIGIYVKTDGVLVIGTGSLKGMDALEHSPSMNILRQGDYIQKVNGMDIGGKKELTERIKACGGEDIILTVKRNEEVMDLKVKPVMSEAGEYKIGIWIRDSAQGIGTMTFMNREGNFGALGHGINDIDTSSLMAINHGAVYDTNIVSVRKGENGNPGELTGVINFNDETLMGQIQYNTASGIYGNISPEISQNISENNPIGSIPIGLKQEVHPGKAGILCQIEDKVEFYDVEITEINYDNDNNNRGIVLKITDEDLISKTGGIVQGMSGAPIIQDGKLIGAVTHVLVKNARKGYGIFIENMILLR